MPGKACIPSSDRGQKTNSSAPYAELDQKGTLEVIRGGVAVFGLRSDLKLAEFKPALGLNEEILKRYKANRLRVARSGSSTPPP